MDAPINHYTPFCVGVCVCLCSSNIYFISRISSRLPLRIGLTEILMPYIESAIATLRLLDTLAHFWSSDYFFKL